MAIFLHGLIASIAVQYLLAETTGWMVVAHQSSCTINSKKKFHPLYLTPLSLSITIELSPHLPLGPRDLAAGLPCRRRRSKSLYGRRYPTTQARNGGSSSVCMWIWDAASRTSNCIVPVNHERSTLQLQLLLTPTRLDLFPKSLKS